MHIPNYQVTPRLPIEQDLKPKARRIQGRYCYGYQDARLVLEQCKNTGRKVSHLYAVWPIENYTFRPDREHCYDYTGLSADQSWEHALQDLEQVKDDGHLFRIWYD